MDGMLNLGFRRRVHRPSPRLKDVELSVNKLTQLYKELIITIRKMYQDCGLIHGDLSEYNMLYGLILVVHGW